MASLSDIYTVLTSGVKGINNLVLALQSTFPRVTTLTIGSFTMPAATSSVIANPLVAANSLVVLMPTNAAAGTLMAGANSLYISARTANVSFTVATAGGGAAAGTETFTYQILTV